MQSVEARGGAKYPKTTTPNKSLAQNIGSAKVVKS